VIPSRPDLLAISRAACKMADLVANPFLDSPVEVVCVDLVSSMVVTKKPHML